MTDLSKRRFIRLTAWSGLGLATRSFGQDSAATYPDRPIRFVVAFPPGGGSDALARLVGQHLGDALGQTVVVDNRPGASGIVAAQAVLAAKHDGYTLLVGGSGPNVFTPITMGRKMPYDAERDIAPITVLGSYANVIAVRSESPYRSLAELVDAARKDPGRLTYGHASATFQVPMEAFLADAGLKMQAVNYKGGGPLATAIMGGEIDVGIADITTFASLHRSGRVRALAVTTFKRASLMPEVPTLQESGYLKDFEASAFTALNAPAGTPPAIVNKLQVEVAKVLQLPEVRKRLSEMSIEPGGRSPEETAARYRREIAIYRPIAEKAGVVEQ